MADNDINDEIYRILGRGKPSDAAAKRDPKLKADWDKAQQLIKDNWKDGVPDSFMGRAFPKYENAMRLGGYGPERAKKLANIVTSLKEFDKDNPDAKVLDRFLNADNTPNGDTPATYFAKHAMAAQKKIESLSPDDQARMQPFLQAQQETLQVLADNGADFSRTNRDGQNVEDIAKIGQPEGSYSSAIDQRFIDLAQSQQQQHQDAVVVEEGAKRDAALNVKEDNQGQTNIGNTPPQQQNLAPQEKQMPKKVVGDVKPEDQENGGGSDDYHGPKIVEKDIIDYLYNDVFIYYLNMLADKIIGYVKGKADRFAEYTRRESAKAQKSQSDLRNTQCDTARQKCVSLFQDSAPEITREMEEANRLRSQGLRTVNAELRQNIESGRPVDQWTFPSLQAQPPQLGADATDAERTAAQARYVAETTAYRNITEKFKELYTQDPANCKQQLDLAEKNLDNYLEMDNSFGKMALQRVMIKKVNGFMDKDKFSWVNSKDLDMTNPKTHRNMAKLIEAEKQEMWQRYALITQVALDRAKVEGLSEADTAKTVAEYQKNFIDLEHKLAEKAFNATMDDVANDRFNAASPIWKAKMESMTKEEKREYEKKFQRTAKEFVENMDSYQHLADNLSSKLEIQTQNGQTTDLKQFTRDLIKSDETQRTFLEDYGRVLDVLQASQEQAGDRRINLGKFKDGILTASPSEHLFTQIYAPKPSSRGGTGR